MHVRDVMTRSVVTVVPTAPVAEVAELLVAHRINAVPVVDDQGVLVGIVTAGDLLHRAADERLDAPATVWKESFWTRSARRHRPELDRADGHTAEEVMTARVATVTPDADLVTVARMLLERRINALPVMTGSSMVGIVSRFDVLSYLAAHGGATNPLEH